VWARESAARTAARLLDGSRPLVVLRFVGGGRAARARVPIQCAMPAAASRVCRLRMTSAAIALVRSRLRGLLRPAFPRQETRRRWWRGQRRRPDYSLPPLAFIHPYFGALEISEVSPISVGRGVGDVRRSPSPRFSRRLATRQSSHHSRADVLGHLRACRPASFGRMNQ